MYVNKERAITVFDRHIKLPIGYAQQSQYKPGLWFVDFCVDGFRSFHAYAVIDDFGSLVEVTQ